MLYEIRGGSVSLGGNLILDHIQFQIKNREKIALVGKNGAGKTTLLRLIAGEITPDPDDHLFHAPVYMAEHISIGRLDQVPFQDPSILKVRVDDYLGLDRTGMEARTDDFPGLGRTSPQVMADDFSDMGRTSPGTMTEDCPDTGQVTEAWSLEKAARDQKILRIFKGLGIPEELRRSKIGDLSGGEREKIVLVRLLADKHDLLLLDEPTNHLDMTSVEWLESYINDYPGAVVIVSHDRYFLDQTAEIVYALDRGKLTRFHGNYSDYQREAEADYERRMKAYKAWDKERRRLQDLIDRFKHKPRKAAMARSKRKVLERMEKMEKPEPREVHRFKDDILPHKKGPKLVAEAREALIGYSESQSMFTLDLSLRRGRKVGILGANGAGKTTLLKTLYGLIPCLSGSIRIGQGVEAGYFTQHSPEEMKTRDEDGRELTVLDHFKSHFPLMTDKEIRNQLASYLFRGQDAGLLTSRLSGGEKSRLMLAELFESRPNLLILDEPTNHMDIPARETIESALKAYKGTILFVTHDRYFLQTVADSLLIIDQDGLHYYPFNYDHYQYMLGKRKQGESGGMDPVLAENTHLIESLKAVPKKERHQTPRFSTDQSFADWQLTLAARRMEGIRDRLEEYREKEMYILDSVKPEVPSCPETTEESCWRCYEDREEEIRRLEDDYTAACLDWYDCWINYEKAFASYDYDVR